jgi:hypothetical protein
MEHNDIRHKLSEFIDGSVTSEERAVIEEHLKTCLQCSSALEELRKTIGHVKALEEIEPPAWMTQKVMATVRAEAEERKGFFHRFFFPLRIKLPIQAITVLFLAVTGFYIYQNIQPAERVSKAPTQESAAKKQAPPTGSAQDKFAKAYSPASRAKSVPHTSEYKALDMKMEYEKPATPILQGQAAAPAPVPAKPAEGSALGKNEVASENRSVTSQAGAPALMREQIMPSSGEVLHGDINDHTSAAKYKKARNAADDTSSNVSVNKRDSQFQLTINQTISFESDNLRLTVVNVTEDSRCPLGVRCKWEGQVTVLINVTKQDQHIGDISLTRRAGNHEDLATKIFDGYMLRLIKVDPYPKHGNPIKSADYRVTLVISKI